MIQNVFTNEKLSIYFKNATIIHIVCLLAIIIQSRYAENYLLLEKIINHISNLNLFFMIFIVILKIILIITMHHKKLISRYNFLILMINFFITMLLLWLLVINHHIEEQFIEFYSKASLEPHHNIKIIYILILIFIILLLDLYEVIESDDKTGFNSIKSITSTIFYIFISQYLIIFSSLIGLMHFKILNKFTQLTITNTYAICLLYFHLFIYMFIILSIIAAGYYSYNRYHKKN